MQNFQFGPALTHLARLVHQANAHNLSSLGLGSGQKAVLWVILSTPGITQSALSERLHLNKSVISRTTKRLIEAGYVARIARKGQSPRKLIPTPFALALANYAQRTLDGLETHLTEGFSQNERNQWQLFTQRGIANLNRHLKETPDPFMEKVKLHKREYSTLPMD